MANRVALVILSTLAIVLRTVSNKSALSSEEISWTFSLWVFGITREWPFVSGNASIKARDFSVSAIILAGISFLMILQKIQSISFVNYCGSIKLIIIHGLTTVAHARPLPNFSITVAPGSRSQFSIVFGIWSEVLA